MNYKAIVKYYHDGTIKALAFDRTEEAEAMNEFRELDSSVCDTYSCSCNSIETAELFISRYTA